MPTDAEPGHDVGGVRELSMPSPGSGSCTVCAWCAHIVSSLPTAGCACPAAEVGRAFEPVRRALPALSFLTPGLERPPR